MTEIGKPSPQRPAAEPIRGFLYYPGWLDRAAQVALLDVVRTVLRQAPLLRPRLASGRQMSVRMSAAGDFGWISTEAGYRYSPCHPGTGQPWPAIPAPVLAIWQALCPQARAPECCLINFYAPEARMGLHQDRDEADLSQPVLSISLGDDALFRIGNDTRGGASQSLWLRSGDVLVMPGPARLRYHGVDRIAPGTSPLMARGGRVNLTLRVVRAAPAPGPGQERAAGH